MPTGISAEALTRRIDQFLGSRGFKSGSDWASDPGRIRGQSRGHWVAAGADPYAETPLDFVCEDDVRLALKAGKKLVVAERAIITPAARDLGEAAPGFHRRPVAGLKCATRFDANC